MKPEPRQKFRMTIRGYFYSLELYDDKGREVYTLDEAIKAAERYHPDWDSVYNGHESMNHDDYDPGWDEEGTK